MYDLFTIKKTLNDINNYNTLIEYCKYLASKYNETNEGKYRIKYNELYPILFHSLSDEKIVEFFNSFTISLNIYPIRKLDNKEILLELF